MKLQGFAQDLYSSSATKKEKLGTLRITSDGRKFRYAYNGAVALTTGVVTSMIGAAANHINRAIVITAAIGDKEVSVTLGATACAANSYEDGYFQVNDADGQGQSYQIIGNTYAASAGTTVVTLADPLRIALTTDSEVSLIYNPWYGTVIMATEATGPAGVTVCAVPINNYYWSQTGGMGCVLSEGSAAVGSLLEHATTNGSTSLADGVDKAFVGQTISTAGVAGEYKPVWLTID